jgi:hypothetical protein
VGFPPLFKETTIMDTKTLKVGQVVNMVAGMCAEVGKVIEVTPSNVIVQLTRIYGPANEPTLIRFDANGKVCDSSDIYNGPTLDGTDSSLPGVRDHGPWELTDILSFSE